MTQDTGTWYWMDKSPAQVDSKQQVPHKPRPLSSRIQWICTMPHWQYKRDLIPSVAPQISLETHVVCWKAGENRESGDSRELPAYDVVQHGVKLKRWR